MTSYPTQYEFLISRAERVGDFSYSNKRLSLTWVIRLIMGYLLHVYPNFEVKFHYI